MATSIKQFKKSLKKTMPLLAIVMATAFFESCQTPRVKEEVVASQVQSGRAEKLGKELGAMHGWQAASFSQRQTWAFSEEEAASAILDVEKNILGWFDKKGRLAWPPGEGIAREIVSSGKVTTVGSLEKRYMGKDSATVKKLREEFTEVAGSDQPATRHALVALVRGAPRDPEAGYEVRPEEGPEQEIGPETRLPGARPDTSRR